MLTPADYILVFLDSLVGHVVLAAYLFTVLDECATVKRLKKLPPLLLSPLLGTALPSIAVPDLGVAQYGITSAIIMVLCTLWVMWAWRLGVWRAFSAVCMAAILQVATTALVQMAFLWLSPYVMSQFLVMCGLCLTIALVVSFALRRICFGETFQILLEDDGSLRRTALLLLALEAAMEAYLLLQPGVQTEYLIAYYLLLLVLVALIVGVITYLARRFDDSRRLQAQQDVIAQQTLYEQSLEEMRKEVRSFRHDYKNLLAGLAQQAGQGELEALRHTLEELDAGFDRRLGEKIQASTQIGNLQIPQVRSLLLGKMSAMGEKGVECRLEVLYPVTEVGMDRWDFVRCLGVLVDNAAEAALETENPWVEIVLLASGGYVTLRVSNAWNGQGDPAKIWEDGYSTKGPRRGTGLAGYQRILRDYPNTAPTTSWENGVFVQELIVGGG